MIMNGYPDPAHRVFYPQVDVWNAIQARNSTTEPSPWATDPIGLRGCLMDLNPPPGGSWNVHMNTVSNEVMFDILYWMNRYSYPVATLTNGGDHWVVIVQYETDIEPVGESAPALNYITIHDPWNSGSINNMIGSTWYSTYWSNPNLWDGTWDNNWVAVIEPPVVKGSMTIEMMIRMGEKIIEPEEAVESAKKWIEELELSKKYPYTILEKRTMTNLQPILVSEQFIGPKQQEQEQKQEQKPKQFTHYYIVPFGFEEEEGLARVSVIVNAYTGEFEEIGAFGKPTKYLSENEAIAIVARVMKLTRTEIRGVTARMMFQPSEMTHIRTYPFWEITIKERERVLYVDQHGIVYNAIKPSVPGN